MSEPLLPALVDPPDRVALRFDDRRQTHTTQTHTAQTHTAQTHTAQTHTQLTCTELTYTELAGAAGALATQLRGCRRVAVHATPSLHTVVAVAAAVLAGVPAVPLNPKLGERERAHVVADAEPELILAAPGVDVPSPLPRVEVDLDAVAPVPHGRHAGAAPALIVYTSGTTGPPKGAVLSRRAVAANLDALAAAWDWTDADLLAHALPLFHVHGLVLGVLGPLRRGGTLHHLGTLDAAALAAAGATLVFGVPTQYHRLADELDADPVAAAAVGRARLLVSGSAALTAVDHARIRTATGSAVRERYGMTETLILTAARAGDEPEPGTVGPPLPGVEVQIVPTGGDGPGGDGPGGEGSEFGGVEVRGPSLFDGYLNRPDATAAATTADGWFATGDIGRFTASGALALVGRSATDLIKSGGYKIGAGEIENALLEHPGVAEAAVVGEADADLGERIVAHVVPRLDARGHAPPERELIAHVAALLAPHKRPREVRFTDALPRNDMGRWSRRG